MYFIKRLQHEVLMHPETFGKTLKEKIHKRLCEDVEGTVHETTGIIVAVLRFHDEQDVERGLIEYETGHASFVINYEAIVFRPFKNQVMDARVSNVHEHGFIANAGLANFNIFVSKHKMPREFAYRADSEMWVAEEEDGAQVISRDCVVRFRVHNLIFPSKKEMVRWYIASINGIHFPYFPPPSFYSHPIF
jgi:DNA-directed RNA polymerase II subunit RPB7